MSCKDEKEAYENLANAIIISAARDYRSALQVVRIDPLSKGANLEIKRLEEFFYSEWFMLLTNMDPGYITERIRKLVYDGK